MRIETRHGPVVMSRASGSRLLSEFCNDWPMPVVRLEKKGDFDADFGVVFQVGEQEVWAFLHLLPPELPSDIELVLDLLQASIVQALCQLQHQNLPGVLMPCAALRESGDGRLVPAVAVFASDGLYPLQGEAPSSVLCAAFIDTMITTEAGSQLAHFAETRYVPRLEVGSIRFDAALVTGRPLAFRLPAADPAELSDDLPLFELWSHSGVKHMPWAPSIPISLSQVEAEAMGWRPPWLEAEPAQSDPSDSEASAATETGQAIEDPALAADAAAEARARADADAAVQAAALAERAHLVAISALEEARARVDAAQDEVAAAEERAAAKSPERRPERPARRNPALDTTAEMVPAFKPSGAVFDMWFAGADPAPPDPAISAPQPPQQVVMVDKPGDEIETTLEMAAVPSASSRRSRARDLSNPPEEVTAARAAAAEAADRLAEAEAAVLAAQAEASRRQIAAASAGKGFAVAVARRRATGRAAEQRAAAARLAAEREAAERAAAERAAAEREAAEREAAERAAAERETAEREAAEREAAQREAAQREAAEREAAEREAAERAAEEREAEEREAAEREAAQREAAEREAAEREAAQREAAAEREAAERAAEERETEEREAAEREAAEREAAERAAEEREAAEREAVEREAEARETAERAAAERADADREVAERTALAGPDSAHEAAEPIAASERPDSPERTTERLARRYGPLPPPPDFGASPAVTGPPTPAPAHAGEAELPESAPSPDVAQEQRREARVQLHDELHAALEDDQGFREAFLPAFRLPDRSRRSSVVAPAHPFGSLDGFDGARSRQATSPDRGPVEDRSPAPVPKASDVSSAAPVPPVQGEPQPDAVAVEKAVEVGASALDVTPALARARHAPTLAMRGDQVFVSQASPEVSPSASTGRVAQLTARLDANPFTRLCVSGGDGVHASLLTDALRTLVARGATSELPDWLGPVSDEARVRHVRRDGAVVIDAGDNASCAVFIRLVGTVDPVELAIADAALAPECDRRVLVTLSPLMRLEVPRTWQVCQLDDLIVVAELAGAEGEQSGFYQLYRDYLRTFAAIRDRFVHDASGDARPWREPLAALEHLAPLEHALMYDVLDAALEEVDALGWPRLTAAALADRIAPVERVLAVTVQDIDEARTLDITVVDPASVHAYGVRARGGLVGVFSERFSPRRTGLDRALVWGRRNAFLRDLCTLTQVDVREVIELPRDDCRMLPLSGFDLLYTPDREGLARTITQTIRVLWDRVEGGRLRMPE